MARKAQHKHLNVPGLGSRLVISLARLTGILKYDRAGINDLLGSWFSFYESKAKCRHWKDLNSGHSRWSHLRSWVTLDTVIWRLSGLTNSPGPEVWNVLFMQVSIIFKHIIGDYTPRYCIFWLDILASVGVADCLTQPHKMNASQFPSNPVSSQDTR